MVHPNHDHFVEAINSSINLAAFVPGTRVLGPGLRAGVWVQGCPFSCQGCIAPDWIPQIENQQVAVNDLVEVILSSPITGLTFSGGEPFLQAEALANLAAQVRKFREIDLIVFSGFTLAALKKRDSAAALLAQTDVLIDGVYIDKFNQGVGLRGSTNQKFNFLTERLSPSGYDYENSKRGLELHFQSSGLLVVGIPVRDTQELIDSTIKLVMEDR
jgi:anaerobic ribonucleoside-triphosphate reductase activating protein